VKHRFVDQRGDVVIVQCVDDLAPGALADEYVPILVGVEDRLGERVL
jgi:hypothetical protein